MGLNCVKAADPLLEDSLLFNIKSPEVFVTKEGWKAESILEPPIGFEFGIHGLAIQCFNNWIMTDISPKNLLILSFISFDKLL